MRLRFVAGSDGEEGWMGGWLDWNPRVTTWSVVVDDLECSSLDRLPGGLDISPDADRVRSGRRRSGIIIGR